MPHDPSDPHVPRTVFRAPAAALTTGTIDSFSASRVRTNLTIREGDNCQVMQILNPPPGELLRALIGCPVRWSAAGDLILESVAIGEKLPDGRLKLLPGWLGAADQWHLSHPL